MAGHNQKRRKDGLKRRDPRRHKWPLEKWPQAMLIDEIQELRRRARVERSGPSTGERQELVESLERAQARTRYVEAELRAAREAAASEGLGEEIAGKPALSKYLSTWNKLVEGIWNLAEVRRRTGMVGVRVAAERLQRYAYSLTVAGPRGEWESGRQDWITRGLQDEATLGVLAWGEPWADRFVARYLRVLAKTLYRPSVWAIYEKSSEMGAVDRYGGATVMK